MDIKYIILTIINHNKGKFSGKTLLQKTIFFLNELLELGISFKPHYYGPYSSDVASSIADLTALGFLEEIEEIIQKTEAALEIIDQPEKTIHEILEQFEFPLFLS